MAIAAFCQRGLHYPCGFYRLTHWMQVPVFTFLTSWPLEDLISPDGSVKVSTGQLFDRLELCTSQSNGASGDRSLIYTQLRARRKPKKPPPRLLVFTGPPGAHMQQVISGMIAAKPELFARVVTHTSREPKEHEVDGVDYHFVDAQTLRFVSAQITCKHWFSWLTSDWAISVFASVLVSSLAELVFCLLLKRARSPFESAKVDYTAQSNGSDRNYNVACITPCSGTGALGWCDVLWQKADWYTVGHEKLRQLNLLLHGLTTAKFRQFEEEPAWLREIRSTLSPFSGQPHFFPWQRSTDVAKCCVTEGFRMSTEIHILALLLTLLKQIFDIP